MIFLFLWKMEDMYLTLNVGGKSFYIRIASLRSVPGTLLTQLVDASLPPDLVFGGRALSSCDEGGREEEKLPTVKKSERSVEPSEEIYMNDRVPVSHPHDRAKHVYLSCCNTFRPMSVSPLASSCSNIPQNDDNLSSAGSTPLKRVTSTTATSTPTTTTTTALPSPDSRLFLPARCLTSPRHKPVPTYDRSHRQPGDTHLQGFTNKTFLLNEGSMDNGPTSKTNYSEPGLPNGQVNHSLIEQHGQPHDSFHSQKDQQSQTIDSRVKPEAQQPPPVVLPHAKDADIYVDRNPLLVPYILDLYRLGQLHLPPEVCSLSIRDELDFWKIPEELIGECCWREFRSGLDRMKVVSAISATLTNRYDDPEVRGQLSKAGRFWLTMERPDYSKRAKIWCGVYYAFILLSIITFMLLTLAEFLETKPEFEGLLAEYTADNDTLHVVHWGTFTKAVDWLEGTEICLDIFFTFEFAARLFTCPDKMEFVRNKHNIIDIMILTTAWTRCIYDRIITWDYKNFTHARSFAMVVLNCLLGLRVLRMLHLAKIFRTLKVMYLSILASMQELALLVVVMGAGILLFGSAIYIAEGFSTPDNEPLMFESIPSGMWWAIITMTTVGYGDAYPVHAAGYVVGAVCAVSGLLLVAMPIAIVASNFSTFYDNMSSRDQSIRRKAILGMMIGVAMRAFGSGDNGGGGDAGNGGNTAGASLTNGNKTMKGMDVSKDESDIRKRNDSGGKGNGVHLETSNHGDTQTRSSPERDLTRRENGHIRTISKDVSERQRNEEYLVRDSADQELEIRDAGSGGSRRTKERGSRVRNSDRPRSSRGSSRSNRTNNVNDSLRKRGHEAGGEMGDALYPADVHKHRRSGSDRGDTGYVSQRETSPWQAEYVGRRADGVGKDVQVIETTNINDRPSRRKHRNDVVHDDDKGVASGDATVKVRSRDWEGSMTHSASQLTPVG